MPGSSGLQHSGVACSRPVGLETSDRSRAAGGRACVRMMSRRAIGALALCSNLGFFFSLSSKRENGRFHATKIFSDLEFFDFPRFSISRFRCPRSSLVSRRPDAAESKEKFLTSAYSFLCEGGSRRRSVVRRSSVSRRSVVSCQAVVPQNVMTQHNTTRRRNV